MMDQLPLFRPTDPATSREGAERIEKDLGRHQQIVLAVTARASLSCTAQEIATRCAIEFGGMAESYRKRIHELVRDGLLIECPPRTCTVTNMKATTYKTPGEADA